MLLIFFLFFFFISTSLRAVFLRRVFSNRGRSIFAYQRKMVRSYVKHSFEFEYPRKRTFVINKNIVIGYQLVPCWKIFCSSSNQLFCALFLSLSLSLSFLLPSLSSRLITLIFIVVFFIVDNFIAGVRKNT